MQSLSRWCSVKVFLKISQNSQENTCAEVFFNKVAARPATLLFKRNSAQAFSCEIFEIFKNTYFAEYLQTSACLTFLKLKRKVS